MDYIISANTDIGIKKHTNQDCLSVKLYDTPMGNMVFAVLCDGMGGLAKGELASATVVKAFMEWAARDLPGLCAVGAFEDRVIKQQWETIITAQNEKIMGYGKSRGFSLGTTVTAVLLTDRRYYIINVGDSRVYEITNGVRQITADHTVVAREISLGNMTEEQAAQSPQRNVLLQCVGASGTVCPDMFFGDTKQNAVYMLCSDGFRHQVTADEIYRCFQPSVLLNTDIMKQHSQHLIELNKQRNETDNISVALIRSF